jgi:C-terminal processing protease CtpA/Prc
MSRKAAIAIAICIAILMVAGVLLFVFQPQKPVPHRHPVVPSELVGVGIMLRANTRTQEVIVQQVVPNEPAAEAGITNNLIITRVDEVSLAGMNLVDVANLIRGPVGTMVKLELATPDHSQTNTVELTRRKLQL